LNTRNSVKTGGKLAAKMERYIMYRNPGDQKKNYHQLQCQGLLPGATSSDIVGEYLNTYLTKGIITRGHKTMGGVALSTILVGDEGR